MLIDTPPPVASVFRRAPAKVNLFLEILGKRTDGFHEIATLMLAVELFDDLAFSLVNSGELVLECDVPELSTGPENLVRRAAAALKLTSGCALGAHIRLTKRIPWAAGLGGGSSDAAATLLGLNELWALGLSPRELMDVGATIGSDVPFFLTGPAAYCTGRGEKVRPVAVGTSLNLVLLKPSEGLSTAEVYRNVRLPAQPLDGQAAIQALADGDVEKLANGLHNRLEEAAFALNPRLAHWKSRLKVPALLSGSGSCLFALCRDAAEAQQVVDDLGVLPESEVIPVRSCF